MKDILEINPIIAAIKNDKQLEEAIKCDCEVVFMLNGDILTLAQKVRYLQKHDKKVFIHIDMVSGLASSPLTVDYLQRELNVYGIISTKANIVKRALELNLKVVQRFFFIDSMSVESAIESLRKVKPNAIEIMPGIMPKVIKRINHVYPNIPIICGGLIDTKEEIISVLASGAMAVSTTKSDIW